MAKVKVNLKPRRKWTKFPERVWYETSFGWASRPAVKVDEDLRNAWCVAHGCQRVTNIRELDKVKEMSDDSKSPVFDSSDLS